MKDKIDKLQLSLISKSKNYLANCKKKEINISASPLCDLNSWSNGLGYEKLLLLKNNKNFSFSFLWQFFLEIINIGRFNFKIYEPNNNFLEKKKLNLVYSYCWKDSFDENSIFYDKYLNLNSKNLNYYFLLISLDGHIPKQINNFTIFQRKKIIFDPILFIGYLKKKLFKKNFIHEFNSTNFFCEFITNFIEKSFANKKISVIVPYESRPHQNAVLSAVRSINKNNKTICYLHNMPWPFQIDMIFKKNNITTLLISSHVQKKVLIKNYLWPKKKIRVIPSLRFSKLKKRENTIFLPYDWTENKSQLIKNFKDFMKKNNLYLKHYLISIHPLKINSPVHLDFKEQILKLINSKYKSRVKKKHNLPIIFSHPGGTVAECLQTSKSVYHITLDKLNIFTKSIWKEVRIKEEATNMYKYSSNAKFIEIKNRKFNLQKII